MDLSIILQIYNIFSSSTNYRPGICTAGEITQHTTEFFSNILLVELFQVHHRCVILAAEPSAALAFLGSAEIAIIATGRFAARAIVLPQAVFKEGLRQADLHESAICP